MVNLYIVGSGGLGRGLADALIFDNHKQIEDEFNNIYFVDDNTRGMFINDLEVKMNIDELCDFNEKCLVINALGEPKVRKNIQKRLLSNRNLIFPNYIDSDVKLYKNTQIGKGNIITRGVVLSTNIEIGDFNLIHFNCTIGHDVKIENYNCIYPLVSLSGYTSVGSGNMIGTGSSSLLGSCLNNFVKVGANSLIRGNYESNITIVGSPAIKISNEIE
ncbi:acetyltransferase [Jeotgalicoccus sp. S0W5]|uniref:acetyltransferase n=1 Tax=Jeotgalicoccus sp. S0W5 TaxID=2527874 RepID=UPI001414D36F|nr:acetyltransferase [Jeotgalicoccus sp. S0W5]